MDFMNGSGRPKPKAGYKCKICGTPGGFTDSHWYQLCPYKGRERDRRNYSPPKKGYFCKYCHKEGGQEDSHWFQQCPKKNVFGTEIPHPLKVAGQPNVINLMPHLAAQAMALGFGLYSQPNGPALPYTQQPTSSTMYVCQHAPQQLNQQQIVFMQHQTPHQVSLYQQACVPGMTHQPSQVHYKAYQQDLAQDLPQKVSNFPPVQQTYPKKRVDSVIHGDRLFEEIAEKTKNIGSYEGKLDTREN